MAVRLGGDSAWFTILAASTLVELVWWMACFLGGIAPAPFLLTHLALAFGGIALAVALRSLFWPRSPRAAWRVLVGGTALMAVGASLFLPLKYAIPRENPFWLDRPLAQAERSLFGVDPWLALDRMLGWATVPVDRIYGMWLPVPLAVFFALLVAPPSPAKSRALAAFSLGWLLLGMVAATFLSSGGPIFYDRLFGGDRFAPLSAMLHSRGALIALAESDRMWLSHVGTRPGLVSGMSAAPSLHVAMSLWIYLTARTNMPRLAPLALGYAIFIWVASVQLGWHYASDGLLGVVGMLCVWAIAGKLVGCGDPVPSTATRLRPVMPLPGGRT